MEDARLQILARWNNQHFKLLHISDISQSRYIHTRKNAPLLQIPIISSRESNRIAIKLKVISGTYVLQSNWAYFKKNKVDPTCMICGLDAEDIEHFVLNCYLLENARKSIIAEITKELYNICKTNLSQLMKSDQLKSS